jgi:hypothetical protein
LDEQPARVGQHQPCGASRLPWPLLARGRASSRSHISGSAGPLPDTNQKLHSPHTAPQSRRNPRRSQPMPQNPPLSTDPNHIRPRYKPHPSQLIAARSCEKSGSGVRRVVECRDKWNIGTGTRSFDRSPDVWRVKLLAPNSSQKNNIVHYEYWE